MGLRAMAEKVICLEHFRCKSVRYQPLGETLPSQEFTFELLRDAMRSGKQVVVMRSERIWLESVPELREYPCIRLSKRRCVG